MGVGEQQSNGGVETVKRLAACICLMTLAASSTVLAKDPGAKATIYCTQGAKGDWSLQRFKPLILVQGGTVFAEMTFEGSVLREVRLRRFFADSELAFDYTFDGAGKLAGLKGSVTVRSTGPTLPGETEPPLFADWLGEAELTPGSDGKIPPHHVQYSREKDRIDKPDDADKYIGRFLEAPVYQTIAAVPCAAMLKEAEKMNATQD
jgi:hypothetical protein